VLGLDVVTGSGERLLLGALDGGGSAPASALLVGLRRLVDAELAVVRTELGRFGRQVSGYSLEHLLPERGFDVARALVGSEGTLALTRTARVRLVRDAPVRVLVVLGYGSMADAADACLLCCGTRRSRARGWTRASSTSSVPAGERAPSPTCRAARVG
jgi:FAD/FMN-containing dehydrogenase